MILACHGINKAFGEEIIVKDGSFHIEDHEKAALVGPNGAGKSTIFKIIAGELPSDGGSVILTKGKTMGYLAQHQDMNTDRSIYEEVRTAKADIIAMEQKKYGAKALVRHHGYQHYDTELTAVPPTVEEFMYFLSKTKTAERRNHEKVIH